MAVELIIDDDVEVSGGELDGGVVRRSGRAPKKPSQSYEDILEKEDIMSEVLKIERASKRVESGQADPSTIEAELARRASKKRSRGSVDADGAAPTQRVALTVPEDVAVVVNTYKPCIVCHELLGVDGLSYCLDCTKYFHGLCLKGSTIPLNCSSCERTRDASNAASMYKNDRLLAEYHRVGPTAAVAKNLFQYRMTLLHRFTNPDLYKGLKTTSKPFTAPASPSPAKTTPKSSARKSKSAKKRTGRSHKKKVPVAGVDDAGGPDQAAGDADADAFFQQTSEPVVLPSKAKNSPRKDVGLISAPVMDDETKDDDATQEDDETKEDDDDLNNGGALPDAPDAATPQPTPQTAVVHEILEELKDAVLVKVEHLVKSAGHGGDGLAGAATTSDFADLGDFGGIPVVTPSPLVPLLSAPTTAAPPTRDEEEDEAPMVLDNIMDDEHHPAVETETYESAWPAGMNFGAENDDGGAPAEDQ